MVTSLVPVTFELVGIDEFGKGSMINFPARRILDQGAHVKRFNRRYYGCEITILVDTSQMCVKALKTPLARVVEAFRASVRSDIWVFFDLRELLTPSEFEEWQRNNAQGCSEHA